jgi:outer membrane protein TolC
LKLAQLSYEQGAGTSIELVDAERSARDAATNASTAQVVAELARVDLLVTTGRWGPAP